VNCYIVRVAHYENNGQVARYSNKPINLSGSSSKKPSAWLHGEHKTPRTQLPQAFTLDSQQEWSWSIFNLLVTFPQASHLPLVNSSERRSPVRP